MTSVTTRKGWDIHDAGKKGYSYRYAPTMVRDGRWGVHAWFCATGRDGYMDIIPHRFSKDGGKTWSKEKTSLTGTKGSLDGAAVCDPDVISVDGWFYMAYTGVQSHEAAGINNHVFVARSKRPDGGWQKWNGKGWGGKPKPIFKYNGPKNKWGLGEPCMTLKGNTIYVYYTEKAGANSARVATSNIKNKNWPAKLVDHGYALASKKYGEDQFNVKYCPDINKFVGLSVVKRWEKDSGILVRYSSDGINFGGETVVRQHIVPKAHNVGISTTALGHLTLDKEIIAYGYGGHDTWGRWNTHANPIGFGKAPRVQNKVKPKPSNGEPEKEKNKYAKIVIPLIVIAGLALWYINK